MKKTLVFAALMLMSTPAQAQDCPSKVVNAIHSQREWCEMQGGGSCDIGPFHTSKRVREVCMLTTRECKTWVETSLRKKSRRGIVTINEYNAMIGGCGGK